VPFVYTPQDAIDLVAAFTKNTPTSALQVKAADMVSSQMWCAYPWQWTLQQISPVISLVNGVQDYSVPSELYRFNEHVRITRTDVTSEDQIELDIVKWLPPVTNYNMSYKSMRLFCHELTLGRLRLPGAVDISGTMTLTLSGEYQANPTQITSTTLSTPLWIPNQYFNVYTSGLLYYFYKFTDDARAGGVVAAKGGRAQYAGQYAVWMNELDMMMGAEDLKTGSDFTFPSNTLGQRQGNAFTIYPQ
jgi:hypothetical protein